MILGPGATPAFTHNPAMKLPITDKFKQAAQHSNNHECRVIEQELIERLIEADMSLFHGEQGVVHESEGIEHELKVLVELNPHQKAYWEEWSREERREIENIYRPCPPSRYCDIDGAVEYFLLDAHKELNIITSISDTALEVRSIKNLLLKAEK